MTHVKFKMDNVSRNLHSKTYNKHTTMYISKP